MTYSEDELRAMIAGMRNASAAFYGDARRIGCHQFIEFCGLMNEFIGLCEDAVAKGQDFTETSIHGDGKPLPMRPHHRAYLNEKLECIYGHSLDAIMGGEMTIKRYNPSVTLMENCVAVVQMIPADDGVAVRWEDHEAEVEAWQTNVAKLSLDLSRLTTYWAEKCESLAVALQDAEVELVKLKAERR